MAQGARGPCFRVILAEGFFQRFVGLMGHVALPVDEGLLFPRCALVHSLFMRASIDVVALSWDGVVLGVQTVAPWHAVRHVPGTAHVLEVASHAADGLEPGRRMAIWGLDDRRRRRWRMTAWPRPSTDPTVEVSSLDLSFID